MLKFRTSFRKFIKKTANIFIIGLVYFGKMIFVVKLINNFDRTKIRNRTLVFLDEGQKRNINLKSISILGKQTRFFIIYLINKQIVFDRLPLGDSYYRISHRVVDNKYRVKKILIQNKLPTPCGKVFRHTSIACDYAQKIGYPVVIKPIEGSLSKNVFTRIINKKDLVAKIDKIKKYEDRFLLEEFIDGDNYRATIVDHKFAGCVMRYPAHVVGDRQHTIKQLIKLKNKHPLRGDWDQLNSTLYKIKVTKGLSKRIKTQGYNLNSILPKNKTVFLSDKINAASGAEIYDVSNKVHPKTIQLFEKIARIFDAKLLGIDYITKTISKPYNSVRSSVIEINSVPYIDLHHYPIRGKSRNVSGRLWDMILK